MVISVNDEQLQETEFYFPDAIWYDAIILEKIAFRKKEGNYAVISNLPA